MSTLTATLTRCRNSQALVTMESAPFNGQDMRPQELRELARQLLALADMADKHPTTGKHWRATRVQIDQEGT